MPDMKIPTLTRAVVTRKIPEAVRQFESDPREVTMRPLSVKEEMDAAKMARLKEVPDAALPFELLRQSVVKIDGKPIGYDDDSSNWVESTSPKCRELLMKGFLNLNRLSDSKEDKFAEQDFFASTSISSE